MTHPSLALVQILRKAAQKLEESSSYQWGHMGACNCGYLAQEVTGLTQTEIHRSALQGQGDWTEQLKDFCPSSHLPLDEIISALIRVGFDPDDLKHLERLSDPAVLMSLPMDERNLYFNVKRDVVKYMKVWATRLEEELANQVMLPRSLALQCKQYEKEPQTVYSPKQRGSKQKSQTEIK